MIKLPGIREMIVIIMIPGNKMYGKTEEEGISFHNKRMKLKARTKREKRERRDRRQMMSRMMMLMTLLSLVLLYVLYELSVLEMSFFQYYSQLHFGLRSPTGIWCRVS